ncbi:Metal tolerance protein 10 [Acorus calamus]|uniref:Metal tolerance protein 10 n=1 Tax=Acorus calamus TaxID=4465 RepID=A0AAV9F738_ACOCL|nr:Metal tolerance protein 10 [Acorus calamus]
MARRISRVPKEMLNNKSPSKIKESIENRRKVDNVELRTDSADYRTELLSPPPGGEPIINSVDQQWRLNVNDFQIPQRPKDPSLASRVFLKTRNELKQLAKNERAAIHISNMANLVLFVAKVYASTESRSLAVITSTLDSLLDLLSGFILWFIAHAMKKPN